MKRVVTDIAEVIGILTDMKMGHVGDRVVIVVDQKPEEFGNTGIIRIQERTARPLIGTIVDHGIEIDEDRAQALSIGKRVSFNRTGAVCDLIELEDSIVELYVMSSRDVYRYWEED